MLLLLLLLAGHPVASSQRNDRSFTVRVGSSAKADAATIQTGLGMVPDGASAIWTLEVEPGVYAERVHVEKAKGPLMLLGLGPPEAVVLTHGCPGGTGNGQPGCTPCPPFNASRGPTPGMRADVATLVVFADDVAVANFTVANTACGFDAKIAAQSDALQGRCICVA